MTFVVAAATAQTDAAGAECSCVSRQYCHGTWLVQETPNFRIWSRLPADQATALASYCEANRAEISRKWSGQSPEAAWVPKCEIVVHSTIAEYNRALVCINNQSVGCTTLKIDQGRAVYRRIDLRTDASGWKDSALPHELTHVVAADLFDRSRLPPWIDEGIASLAEPQSKQEERQQALNRAFAAGRTLTIKALLELRQAPGPEFRDAFYGQSVSLVAFLVQSRTSAEFARFVNLALERGEEAALNEVYGIRGVGQLERRWLAWNENGRRIVPASDVSQRGEMSRSAVLAQK